MDPPLYRKVGISSSMPQGQKAAKQAVTNRAESHRRKCVYIKIQLLLHISIGSRAGTGQGAHTVTGDWAHWGLAKSSTASADGRGEGEGGRYVEKQTKHVNFPQHCTLNSGSVRTTSVVVVVVVSPACRRIFPFA